MSSEIIPKTLIFTGDFHPAGPFHFPVPPFRRFRRRAFTLIEIVVALGVISFALVGIIGLFPVALETARDSQNETRVAALARTLYSDLQTRRGLQRAPGSPVDTTIFPAAGTATIRLNYDREGTLLASGDGRVFFLVDVILSKNPPLLPGGYQADLAVSWPGATGVTLTALLR